ncbi:MAG: tetratricopeptide repeat protein [Pirellulaceae bacterium]
MISIALLGFLGIAGVLLAHWFVPRFVPPQDALTNRWDYTIPALQDDLSSEYRDLVDNADAAIRTVMETYPESPNAVAALAVRQFLSHDQEAETRCWERCLQLDPTYYLAYSWLVDGARQRGDHNRIVELMTDALLIAPTDPNYVCMMSTALMHLQRTPEALQILERHYHRGLVNQEICWLLGEAYNELGEIDKAKECLEKAVELAPHHGAVWYTLATVYAKSGEPQRADDCRAKFQTLKTAQQQTAVSNNARGNIQEQDRQVVPRFLAQIFVLAGQAYIEEGDYERGKQHFLDAAATAPADVECRNLLANVYQREGNLAEAFYWLRELQRIEPGVVDHYWKEAFLHCRARQFNEAETLFRKICELEPDRGDGYMALAELYVRCGRDLAEARTYAETALRLGPTARSYSILATIARQSGDLAAARTAARNAITLEPNNVHYRAMYNSLFEGP